MQMKNERMISEADLIQMRKNDFYEIIERTNLSVDTIEPLIRHYDSLCDYLMFQMSVKESVISALYEHCGQDVALNIMMNAIRKADKSNMLDFQFEFEKPEKIPQKKIVDFAEYRRRRR